MAVATNRNKGSEPTQRAPPDARPARRARPGRGNRAARRPWAPGLRAMGLPTRRDEYMEVHDPPALTHGGAARAALVRRDPTEAARCSTPSNALRIRVRDVGVRCEQSDDLNPCGGGRSQRLVGRAAARHPTGARTSSARLENRGAGARAAPSAVAQHRLLQRAVPGDRATGKARSPSACPPAPLGNRPMRLHPCRRVGGRRTLTILENGPRRRALHQDQE